MHEESLSQCTVDGFLDGRVTLIQPRDGHRAGLDAALLQALVPAEARGKAVDLGAGVGTIAFCVAARAPGMSVIACEREAGLVEAAEAALARPENAHFAGRVRMIHADLTDRAALREASGVHDGSADWVLMNPPFDVHGQVRESPDRHRRSAHVAEADSLRLWIDAAAGLLKPGGTVGLIHRAAGLAGALAALSSRYGDIRVLPVHPSGAKPAARIVIRAARGSRAGLRLMPSLVLHDTGGAWTPAADAILRGRAELGV